jgi:site-specific recombinase XerD
MIPLKYSQALQGFFLNAEARRLSPHTIADYKNSLVRKFQPFLGEDLLVQEITTRHIELFLADQDEVSKKTLFNYYTGLAAFWTWAVHEKIAPEHVVRAIKPPKPEQIEIVPYTELEVRTLLSHLERSKRYARAGQRVTDHAVSHIERNRAIILLLVDTGLRNDELCSAKLHDLDKRNQRIFVLGKGAKKRHVSFSTRAHQALWRYLAIRDADTHQGDPLFVTHGRRPFARRRLLDLIQTIGARAGVTGVTVHRFRHTFAIQYLRNGGDAYTLQRLLGHSTLEMVKRYLAIAQSDIEAAHKRASPVDNWAL